MEYVAVLLPSLVVGLIFWFAMKSIFNADKAERQAEAKAQAEADARSAQAAPQNKSQPSTPPKSPQDRPQAFPPAGTSGTPDESDK